MTEVVASRNRRESLSVLGVTWVSFVLAIALALPQPPDPTRLILGGVLGAVIISTGFWAASRCRTYSRQTGKERTIRAGLSLLAGVALGLALLCVLIALARIEPALRARFAGRAGEPHWRPWALAFESSIIEEIVFRLFIMSLLAWILSKFARLGSAPFALAWVFSTLLFGLAHLAPWLALTGPAPGLIAGVLALNGAGGLLFGWIFWRWGLPYAILCHAAGDVVIQSLAPRFLA